MKLTQTVQLPFSTLRFAFPPGVPATEQELTSYLVHNRLVVTFLERLETLVVNKQHAQLNYWILRGKMRAVFRIPA